MATISLILRINKGIALTYQEVDDNFTDLQAYAAALDDELRVELVSTVENTGASLVGIEDPSSRFTGINVEDAFDEVPTSAELVSVENGEGASLIGIEDPDDNYAATDVETAMDEIDEGLRSRLRIEDIANDFYVSGFDSTVTPSSLLVTIADGIFLSNGRRMGGTFPGNITLDADRLNYVDIYNNAGSALGIHDTMANTPANSLVDPRDDIAGVMEVADYEYIVSALSIGSDVVGFGESVATGALAASTVELKPAYVQLIFTHGWYLWLEVDSALHTGADGNDTVEIAIVYDNTVATIESSITGSGTTGDPYLYEIRNSLSYTAIGDVYTFINGDSNVAGIISINTELSYNYTDTNHDHQNQFSSTPFQNGTDDDLGIRISWDEDTFADGYRVYRRQLTGSDLHDDFRLVYEDTTGSSTVQFDDMDSTVFIEVDGLYVYPESEVEIVEPPRLPGYVRLWKFETDGTEVVETTDFRDLNSPKLQDTVDLLSDQVIVGEKIFSEFPKIPGSDPTDRRHPISLGALNDDLLDLINPGHGIIASPSVVDEDVTIDLVTDYRHGGNVSGEGGIHLDTYGNESWNRMSWDPWLYTAPSDVTPHMLHLVVRNRGNGQSILTVQWENDAGQILRPYTRVSGGYEDNEFMISIPFLFGATRLRFVTGSGSTHHPEFLMMGLSFTSLPDYVTPAPGTLYYTGWYVPTGQSRNEWDNGNWSSLTTLDYNTSYINENAYNGQVNNDRIWCYFDDDSLAAELATAEPIGIESVELSGVVVSGSNQGAYPMDPESTVRMLIDDNGSYGASLGPELTCGPNNQWKTVSSEFGKNPWLNREWRLEDFTGSPGSGQLGRIGISAYRHGNVWPGSGWISCTYLRARVKYRK